jgi:hypothetical protein
MGNGAVKDDCESMGVGANDIDTIRVETRYSRSSRLVSFLPVRS